MHLCCVSSHLSLNWVNVIYLSRFPFTKPLCFRSSFSSFRSSSLSCEKVSESIVIVLVEGRVDERVKKRVWVSQPEKDTFPDRGDITWTQRNDELGKEKRNPAEHEHANQDAHHQSRSPLFLFSPRLAIRLERYSGVANCKGHLRLAFCLFHLAIDK